MKNKIIKFLGVALGLALLFQGASLVDAQRVPVNMLLSTNNLSDVNSVSTAVTNLGLQALSSSSFPQFLGITVGSSTSYGYSLNIIGSAATGTYANLQNTASTSLSEFLLSCDTATSSASNCYAGSFLNNSNVSGTVTGFAVGAELPLDLGIETGPTANGIDIETLNTSTASNTIRFFVGGNAAANLQLAIASGSITTADSINSSSSIKINGTAVSTSTGANPTASIGTAAVNGTANTFMRSDGAPTINQAATFSFSALGNTTSTGSIGAVTVQGSTSGSFGTTTANGALNIVGAMNQASGAVSQATTTVNGTLAITGTSTVSNALLAVGGRMFSGTANVNINNTTTLATLIGSGVGTTTIPANVLVQGSIVHMQMGGTMGDAATPTSTFQILLGASTVVSTAPVLPSGFAAGTPWVLNCDITVTTAGSSGVWNPTCGITIPSAGTLTNSNDWVIAGATSSVNTTIANIVNLKYQWSAASASNSVTSTQSSILLYP